MHDVTKQPERALAVAVGQSSTREQNFEHLDELAFLAETAGAEIIQKIYQERPKLDGATAVGKGKVEEIQQIIGAEKITLVIFDNDLTPAQTRNLEKQLEVKVLDRTGIILDIFAARAQTMEAKTQVELAQLQYLLPRLSRMWTHLSKQYGGIGTKGPGETQIETDRRMIRTRIGLLKEKLEKISTQKEQQRKGRGSLTRFALVGYTNAGKSTLMNVIAESDVLVENKLFATLDTTVRTISLPNGKPAILSDTVGFIRKLPAHLVASFRSTLAETIEADILLHVVDVYHAAFRDQILVVQETLESLGAHEKPTIYVFNKIDAIESLEEVRLLVDSYPNSVAISALRGIGVSTLLEKMQELSDNKFGIFQLLVPYTEMKLISELYKLGEIIERKDLDEGIYLEIKVENRYVEQVRKITLKFAVEN